MALFGIHPDGGRHGDRGGGTVSTVDDDTGRVRVPEYEYWDGAVAGGGTAEPAADNLLRLLGVVVVIVDGTPITDE